MIVTYNPKVIVDVDIKYSFYSRYNTTCTSMTLLTTSIYFIQRV